MSRLPSQQPGFFVVREGAEDSGWYMDFNCPCGCGMEGYLPLYRQGQPKTWSTSWSWDGNVERPTLEPSIKRRTPCGWHGFLKVGNWQSCGDGAPNAANVYSA